MKTFVRQVFLGSLALLVLAAPAMAQSTPYYITDGSGPTMWIVQNGTIQATLPTFLQGGALAITDSVWIEDFFEGGAIEYTLAGAPTGNTSTGSGVYSRLFDGTTDGQYNYAIASGYANPNPVLRFDRNWQNPTILFYLPNDVVGVGITYDPTTGHLFISDESSGTIAEYDLAGNLINTIDTGLGNIDIAALAYERASDSLWFTTLEFLLPSNIYNYSKTGTQLAEIDDPGFSFTPLGGEFVERTANAVPTTSPHGVVVLTLLLAVAGFVVLRSRA